MRRAAVPIAIVLQIAACSSGESPGPSAPGTAGQSPSATMTEAEFSVTVNEATVRGHCTGSRDPGEPVVILQSGTGAGPEHLSGIQSHMAREAMVCAFGRPGAGGNPPPPDLPRSVDDVVAEVHAILEAADITPPYFLVGQSGGAVITFLFAQAYPDEVAGFVFMNGNPPYESWTAEATTHELPQDMAAGAETDFTGQNPEGIDFRSNESMLTNPLPATMPYAVMYDESYPPHLGDFQEAEAALYERLAEVGDGGRFIWARGGGHEIHVSMPELVHETIDEVWAEATD